MSVFSKNQSQTGLASTWRASFSFNTVVDSKMAVNGLETELRKFLMQPDVQDTLQKDQERRLERAAKRRCVLHRALGF